MSTNDWLPLPSSKTFSALSEAAWKPQQTCGFQREPLDCTPAECNPFRSLAADVLQTL